MPADIETFFSGEGLAAWHGLGTVVDGVLTAAEALKTAGLDWRVNLQPTFYRSEGGAYYQIPDRYSVVRDSDGKPFEVVGGDYVPFQNVESFSFLDAITDKTGDAHYTTAGALAGGKKVFLTAKVGDDFLVNGDDAHGLYLIVSNTHDGKQAFTAAISVVRVVCQNTLTLALNSAKSKWSLRHTTSLAAQVQQARESLGLAYKYQDAFEAQVQELIETQVSMDQFLAIVGDLLPEQPRAKERHLDDLAGSWLHETSPSGGSGSGTAWDALNAATYWTDNVKASRSDEALFKSVNGGFADRFRNDVVQRTLALA